MTCQPNCGKCCSCLPLPPELLDKHKNKIQVEIIKLNSLQDKVFPITADLQCIFLNRQNKKCEIYEERPQICHNYGPPECLKWRDFGRKKS